MIMDGTTLRSGAVAAVSGVANPISLARKVMDSTAHCLLVGQGAEQFAQELGISAVDESTLVTDDARQELEQFQQYSQAVSGLFNKSSAESGHDTVGAVAYDSHGHVASGTSTGGITGKRVGRVGDSPLVGCGGLADNACGACSTTGHGESIIAVTLASSVVNSFLPNLGNAQQAAQAGIERMWHRVKGRGGVIVIGSDGEIGHYASTKRMAWASAKGVVHEEPSHVASGLDNDAAYAALQ